MAIVLDGTSGITTNSGTLLSTNDATISGLTVGKGGGSEAGSTTVGSSSLGGASTNTGTDNSAFGFGTLYVNTSGSSNSAFGRGAMRYNTTGGSNSAFGYQALNNNTTASRNTAVGYQSGYTNSTNGTNTYLGAYAGNAHTGLGSVFVGDSAGYQTTGNYNTFVGANNGTAACGSAVTTGTKNTILGGYSGNQGGLDIRTASNYVVLSDGDGNPRGVFDSNGVLRLGDVGTAPAYGDTKLSIQRSNTNIRLVDFNNSHNVSGDENLRVQLGANCNNTSSYHIICTTGGNDRLYVYGNGNLVNSSGGYGTISDQKLKDNIVDATPKLQDLMQLRVRNYNLKAEPDLKQIGFVAQEFEQVFPALVDSSDDKDEEGNSTGDVTKSIKTSVLIPILVKSIQELKALVDAQATEIAELKAKVA